MAALQWRQLKQPSQASQWTAVRVASCLPPPNCSVMFLGQTGCKMPRELAQEMNNLLPSHVICGCALAPARCLLASLSTLPLPYPMPPHPPFALQPFPDQSSASGLWATQRLSNS